MHSMGKWQMKLPLYFKLLNNSEMMAETEPQSASHLIRNQHDFLIRESYIAFTILTGIED